MPSLKPNGKRLNGRGSKWITPVKRLAIYLRDEFRCVYCGRDLHDAHPRELTLDHLTPRCKGGSNEHTNLITACLNCNSRRQHRGVTQWLRAVVTDAVREVGIDPDVDSRLVADELTRRQQRIARVRRQSLRRYLALAKDVITRRSTVD
jgi:hypothetical protein